MIILFQVIEVGGPESGCCLLLFEDTVVALGVRQSSTRKGLYFCCVLVAQRLSLTFRNHSLSVQWVTSKTQCRRDEKRQPTQTVMLLLHHQTTHDLCGWNHIWRAFLYDNINDNCTLKKIRLWHTANEVRVVVVSVKVEVEKVLQKYCKGKVLNTRMMMIIT